MGWSVFRWVTGIVGAIVVIAAIGIWGVVKFRPHLLELAIPPGLPERDEINRVVWLGQNWSEHDRFWFHHASQGTATVGMPYDWFVSMEAPKKITLFSNPPLLRDPAYLSRMGFISSSTGWAHDSFGYRRDNLATKPGSAYSWTKFPGNLDGLPVGSSRMKVQRNPETGEVLKVGNRDKLGFNCATCHTGQFNYKGTNVRVDGGPGIVDLGKFRSAMKVALVLTAKYPGRLDRFARRLAARKAGNGTPVGDFELYKVKLAKDLKEAFARVSKEGKLLHDIQLARCENGKPKERGGRCTDIEEGFGRLDALNRIGNQVFFKDLLDLDDVDDKIKPNKVAISAPVNFPHLWSTPWFLWAQYDASIMQPLIRNGGEALGVSALINLKHPNKPDAPLYGSTVDFEELIAIEKLLQGKDPFKVQPGAGTTAAKQASRKFQGLRAPKWPKDLFPNDGAWKIDNNLKAKGRVLYGELCARCHLPPVSDPKFWSSESWVDFKGRGTKFLVERELPQKFLGTDASQGDVLLSRQVFVPEHLKIEPAAILRSCGFDPKKFGIEPGVQTKMPFALALMGVTAKTVEAWMDKTGKSAAERKAIWGVRDNCPNKKLLAGKSIYRARPLNGIWATAPFLHNGAVPTLWDLLSPLEKRRKIFCLGNREFDPKKVGYVANCEKKKWSEAWDFRRKTTRIDVSTPGNSNSGHRFENGPKGKGVIGRELAEDERWALIEYLKTL